jgi:putative flavoprotein involved in K+ transport
MSAPSLSHRSILSGRVERYGTVVIGAGSAGLAAAYHLASRDVDFIVLTDEARVGDNWRRRWDSLRLFTPAKYSSLPGMAFPAPPNHFADKDEVAAYLERYAERFDLPVRLDTRVRSLSRMGDRFVIEVDGMLLEADNVVVATGAFQTARIPSLSTSLSAGILQLHSSQYHSPFDLPEGPTLVVGAGNSGAQIAIELAKHRKVWLAGRNTGHMARRVLGRDVFDWIWPVLTRMTNDGYFGRRALANAGSGDALIGIPEEALAAAGVVRVGRVTDARGGRPVCDDTPMDPRVIVWCTGFQPDFGWIDLPIHDEHGKPRHVRGIATDVAGLYFMGLRYQSRVTSSLLGGVATDAEFIAEHLAVRDHAQAM